MLLSQSLISALNHLLRHEPWACHRLLRYAGKAIQFNLPLTTVTFAIDADGLMCAYVDQPIAVTLDISQLAIAAFFLEGKAGALKRIRIEGDAELAATLSELSEQLRWEIEEDLAKLIGPIAAHTLVTTAQQSQQHCQRFLQNHADNWVEYALYEQPTLINHTTLESFNKQVVTLRDDVARLEKRIERLGSQS